MNGSLFILQGEFMVIPKQQLFHELIPSIVEFVHRQNSLNELQGSMPIIGSLYCYSHRRPFTAALVPLIQEYTELSIFEDKELNEAMMQKYIIHTRQLWAFANKGLTLQTLLVHQRWRYLYMLSHALQNVEFSTSGRFIRSILPLCCSILCTFTGTAWDTGSNAHEYEIKIREALQFDENTDNHDTQQKICDLNNKFAGLLMSRSQQLLQLGNGELITEGMSDLLAAQDESADVFIATLPIPIYYYFAMLLKLLYTDMHPSDTSGITYLATMQELFETIGV